MGLLTDSRDVFSRVVAGTNLLLLGSKLLWPSLTVNSVKSVVHWLLILDGVLEVKSFLGYMLSHDSSKSKFSSLIF